MKTFVKLTKNEMKMVIGGTIEELNEGDEKNEIDECRISSGCSQGCARGKYCSTCCIA